ncbi:MAG: glycosyltransferase family 4 protein [Actinobacteria bacterium]|nr:glycosyltransferase family 4 protein [Actinomycetota bacterium]
MSPTLLIVTPFGTAGGGAELWLLGILGDGALQRGGWSIDAIVLQEGPLTDELRQRGVKAITYPLPASPAGIVRRTPRLRRLITARTPDVVLGNGVKAQLAVALALAGLSIPTVWIKHDHSYDRSLARALAKRVDTVVSTALEVGEPTRRNDLVVIEPPRPLDPLTASEAAHVLRDHGWQPTTRLTLAMLTRLVPYKGVDLAISALAESRCNVWELLVIGDDDPSTPEESRRLRALAERLGVNDRFQMTGHINEAGRLLSAVDAVAVLTRPGQPGAPTREGFGIVAAEAMLAGIPVIVAQEGPISRRLRTQTGPAGVTLQSPTSEHLAEALVTLADEDTRASMGARGVEAARNLPDQAQVTQAFADVIERYRPRP